MKGKMKLAVLGGLVLLLAGSAIADYNVLDRSTHYTNASTGLRTNSTGDLRTLEVDPAMDANLTFSNIISRDSLSMGQADSSAILDTHRMRLGMLLIKPFSGTGTTGTVDTTCIYRIAVQIRTHLNGSADSSSTFAIYNYGSVPAMNQTAAGTVPDTSSQGQTYDNATLGTYIPSNVINAWSGENTIWISAQRFAYGSSIDVNGNTFYYPNGIAISLQNLFGRELYSPHTSVRVRLMTVQKGAAELSTARIGLQVHLIGTPL